MSNLDLEILPCRQVRVNGGSGAQEASSGGPKQSLLRGVAESARIAFFSRNPGEPWICQASRRDQSLDRSNVDLLKGWEFQA